MGLPGIHGKFDNCPVRFSDDVLRIEVSGPNNHQFSVVDIPGIFHSEWHRLPYSESRQIN